ncbi:MAG: LytR/AlgR family response regulator transcription factor [Cellulosilyticaceae bacterium]
MLKIGLCDDQPFFITQLSEILNQIASVHHIALEITSFESGETLLNFCSNHPNYFDILFLDILMTGLNGIDTASQIRRLCGDVYIIFVTSSKEYALDSYSVNAYSYILKPFTYSDIAPKFLALHEKITYHKKNVIYVKNNQDIYTLHLDEVIYFESNLRKITAFMNNGEKISFYNKMSKLEEEINSSLFLRCHRSFLVNLMYVKNLVGFDLITTTHHQLPISKKYSTAAREAFTDYIKVKLSM